ncbi:MAG TPA: hypothetical protein DCM38_09280 [Gammaproteobacteria bacterium]|nr:hypothetical protein [Gammaproteobacteria bacterium]
MYRKWFLFLLIGIVVITLRSANHPFSLSEHYQIGDIYMDIRLWGTVELPPNEINGLKMGQLSGLAWDEDEKLLYALSDRGIIFHLRPLIKNNTLTSVRVISAYLLKNTQGKTLRWRDAEGIVILKGHNGIMGDSQLLIMLEIGPRLALFTPEGKPLDNYTLPKTLQTGKNYAGSNKILESVTVHPTFGIITAPEWPLKEANKPYSLKGEHKITLYTLNQRQWILPAFPAKNSGVVALETLEDGSILILERAFYSIYTPLIISLRRVWLSSCQSKTGLHSESEQVAIFDNTQGWHIDNFEGLTHHQGRYFFIVSDNNHSRWQRTLLSYFEIQ